MGTSGDAASLQKLHEDISTSVKALEGLGCESLIVTVTKNGYCQLGSKKGRKYLEEKFSLIMDFIHFCQDPKETKTEAEDGTDKEASGDAPHTPEQKDEDDIGDDELYEEMDEADEEGAYEFLHFNYLDVTGEGEENEDDDDEDEEDDVKDKIIVVKQEDIVGGRPIGKLRAVKTITKPARRSKPAKKNVGAIKKSPSTPRPPISKDRTFDCDQCDKKYRRFEDLQIHKRKHTGETPFSCDTCGKSFRSRNSLRSHQISHSATRHYGCEICGKVFTRASGIYKHRFTHSAATPHECETCGKAFADPSNLKKHRRLHTGTKKFGCEDCTMRFWEKKDLEDHRRVHTGEKPFECEVCGDRFRRKKNLATHKRKHSRGMAIPVQTIILS